MTREERWSCLSKGLGSIMAVVGTLLAFSLALWSYGELAQDARSLPWILLALFLSSWTAVVGLAGSAVIPVWLVFRARNGCK